MMVDEALTHVEEVNPGKNQILEFRFCGDMTITETTAATGISPMLWR